MAQVAFDREDALKRLVGNKDLFKRILNKFYNSYQNTGSELTTLINEGKFVEAERLVHAIKGVAGNLGAKPLFQASQELDALLKQGGLDGRLLDTFITELKDALEAVAEVIAGL